MPPEEEILETSEGTDEVTDIDEEGSTKGSVPRVEAAGRLAREGGSTQSSAPSSSTSME